MLMADERKTEERKWQKKQQQQSRIWQYLHEGTVVQ